jgi:hypothetical protein
MGKLVHFSLNLLQSLHDLIVNKSTLSDFDSLQSACYLLDGFILGYDLRVCGNFVRCVL